jgi:hypothetical protein
LIKNENTLTLIEEEKKKKRLFSPSGRVYTKIELKRLEDYGHIKGRLHESTIA